MTAKFGLLINANVKGENNIKRLGNSMQGVQGKVKNLKMAVGGLSTAFKALGAALAVGAIANFAKRTIDQADAFGKLSTRTGIAANELQAFVNAGKLADVSQKQLETGLKSFARTSYEAGQGVKTYADAYAALGVGVKKADGSLKASDDLLKEIADKFKDLPNGPEKAAIAMRLFGKSGADMITLLNGGSEALERFNYEVSDNFAQNAEYFNDQLTILSIQFDGFRKQLLDALLPALNAIVEVFGDLFSNGQDLGPLFKTIEIGVRGVASVVLGLVQSMRFFIRTISDLAKIAGYVITGEFGKAGEVAGAGLTATREQFFKDMQAQGKVLFGRSEVGTDYGGGGTGGFAAMSDSKAKAQTEKANREADRAAKAAAKEAEERRKAFGASVLQLEASEAALRIARESDPLKKIELQYEERKRVLLAENANAMLNSQSIEEALNIGRMTRNQLDELGIEKQRELKAATEELDQSFAKTFKEGFNEYRKTLGDFAGQVSAAVTGTFQGMEDAIVNFVLTGKASFRDFANSVIADIARIAVRQAIIKPLVGGITGLFGFEKGGVFAQNGIVPFAKGGIVNKPTMFAYANGGAGRFGLMGEAGAEAIMPLRRGPGGRLGVEAAGGMSNIVVNVDATGSAAQGDDSRSKQLGEAIGVAVRHELIRQKRPGGLLS